MNEKQPEMPEWSRREFIAGTSAALAVAAAAGTLDAQTGGSTPAIAVDRGVPHSTIRLTVNGVVRQVEVEDRWSLAELLRDVLGLTGTKLGCDRGECGACTVLVDDKPVYSCSNLAVWMDGRHVTTVEGLSSGASLAPLQQAFVEHDAAQCGFCTSGQLLSATALLKLNPTPAAAEVKAALSGNLCRCGNYSRYVDAVVAAGTTVATRSNGGGGQ